MNATGLFAAVMLSLATPARAETAMVTDVGGVAEVVLAPYLGEAPRSARVQLREGVWVVHADLAERELPSLPVRPGERVRVFDASGAICTATLGRAEIISRRSSEFQDGDGAKPAAPHDRALIESVWDAEPSDHRIVAPLQVTHGTCKHPVFVLAGDDAAGLYARDTGEPPAALSKLAVAALRTLPEMARHQPDYDAFRAQTEDPLPARWEDQADTVTTVRVLHSELGEKLVAVSLSAGQGCSGFGASVGALYRIADGRLQLVRVLDGLDVGELTGVVRESGRDRLLFPNVEITAPAAGERTSDDVGTPYHTCGC